MAAAIFESVEAEQAFDVSALDAYVKQEKGIINKAVLYGAPSVEKFIPMTDVKYKAKLHFLGVSGSLQDGKGCATEYNATAALTDREITTAVMEKKMKICPDTLLGYWGEYLVKIPADKRASGEIPFEAYLVDALLESVQDELETLVWQGDADAVSNPDLIDGILTILGDEATCIDVTIPAGTSMWSAVKSMVAAVPAKIRRKNIRVYVSPEHFQMLAFELVDANLYHFAPESNLEEITLPGTNVKVINTPGLADSDAMVATTDNNIYYGTDEVAAFKNYHAGWNDEHGYAYINVRFNAGVQVAFPDWCVLGTFSGDPISPDNESAIASIATSAAALAADTKVFKTKEQS